MRQSMNYWGDGHLVMNLANRITIARMALIPLFMICFYTYPSIIADEPGIFRFLNEYGKVCALILFVVAASTDKLDGYIARKYNQITNLGKLLDPLADKLLISAALIMLAESGMIPSWIAVIIIGREFAITALRLAATGQGIALAADRFGKIKMVLQVSAIIAVLLNTAPFHMFAKLPVDEVILLAAAILTVLSGLHYIVQNVRLLR